MTTSNKNQPSWLRPTLARAGKAALLALPLGLALTGFGQQAQAQPRSCEAALADLTSEWQAIGFAEPSKPSQMIVRGQNGYTTTAGRFYYLRAHIRSGSAACAAGREEEAMRHINVVHTALVSKGTGVQYGD